MDLKMENVYITYNDMDKPIYKIGDLGLVRSLEPLDASDSDDNDSLTAASRNDAVCLPLAHTPHAHCVLPASEFHFCF